MRCDAEGIQIRPVELLPGATAQVKLPVMVFSVFAISV